MEKIYNSFQSQIKIVEFRYICSNFFFTETNIGKRNLSLATDVNN